MSAKPPGNGAVSFHLPKRLGALWRDEKGYRSRRGKCRRVIRDLMGPSVTAVPGSCVSMFPKLRQHLVSKEEKGGFLCLLDLGDGNVVLIYSSQVFPNCTQHWFFFFSNFSSLFDPKQLGEGNLVGIIQAPCADISPYDSSNLTVFTFFFFFNWTIFTVFLISLYSKVNQLYGYMSPLLFGFPSHLGHHRALSRIPWPIQ